MSEYVIMPKADYTAACNAIRAKTGKADLIKSGDMEGEILGITSGGGSSADVRYVTFMNEDGTVELGKKAVATGDDCADPIARGVFSTPTKESTAQYTYTFYGWATTPNGAADSNWNKAVSEDRTVYANFVSAVRYYTITYYDSDGTTVLKTESLAFGSMPSYRPSKEGHVLAGWIPAIATVTGNASYTVEWEERVSFESASWEKIKEICGNREAADYFKLGDTRVETLTHADGTTEDVTFEVVHMFTGNENFLNSSNKSTISMVLMAKHVLETPYMFNDTSVTSSKDVYFYYVKLDTYIKNEVVSWLPEDMKNAIASVSQSYGGINDCKLQIPTNRMLFGYKYDYDGYPDAPYAPDMLDVFKNGRTKVCKTANGTAVDWWLSETSKGGAAYGLRPTYITASGTLTVLQNYAKVEKYIRLMCYI